MSSTTSVGVVNANVVESKFITNSCCAGAVTSVVESIGLTATSLPSGENAGVPRSPPSPVRPVVVIGVVSFGSGKRSPCSVSASDPSGEMPGNVASCVITCSTVPFVLRSYAELVPYASPCCAMRRDPPAATE